MRYLLDTHALLWWLLANPKLTSRASAVIENGAQDIYVSAASAWEITTKHRLGKLPDADEIAGDVEGRIRQEGFIPLPVSMREAELAGRLKGAHRDPFDRMLIAQAILGTITLVSNERIFDAFGVARLW